MQDKYFLERNTDIPVCISQGTERNVCVILSSKKYADELKTKMQTFQQDIKSKKTLFLTMITTFGLMENQYSNSLVQQSMDMNILFDF